MTLCIVDPHYTDEFIQPLRNFLRRRKAIKKFNYVLGDHDKNYFFATSGYLSGIMAPRTFSRMPSSLTRAIILFERLGYSLSGTSIKSRGAMCKADSFLYVLRNTNDQVLRQIVSHLDAGYRVYGLCSHAHLLEQTLGKLDRRVVLLCDKEVMDHPWFSEHRSVHLPLIPDKRFVKTKAWTQRSEKILALGTVHQFRTRSDAFQQMPDGMFSLHPSRYDILQRGSDTVFDKKFSVVRQGEDLAISQHSYMSLDLVQAYNNYRYACVGSDALGIAANGLYEGMACGCEMFLETQVAISLGLKDGVHVWTYTQGAETIEQKHKEIIQMGMRLKEDPVDIASQRRTCGIDVASRLRSSEISMGALYSRR
jgi:hypothetical protein